MKPIVVLCAGGHGQDIAAIVKNSGQPFAGYLDDNIDGPDILGPCLDLEFYDNYLIGHNDSRIREQMDRAEGAAIAIHASAAVHLTLQALPGVVIGAHTTIGPKTRLGRHSHVNGNVFITRAHRRLRHHRTRSHNLWRRHHRSRQPNRSRRCHLQPRQPRPSSNHRRRNSRPPQTRTSTKLHMGRNTSQAD